MKIKFTVIYNNFTYKQPFCRFKVDENGGITTLIKQNNKWYPVKVIYYEYIET